MTMPGSRNFLRLNKIRLRGDWKRMDRWGVDRRGMAFQPPKIVTTGSGSPALRVGAASFLGSSQILLVLPDLPALVRARGRHQPHPPPHPGKEQKVQKVGATQYTTSTRPTFMLTCSLTPDISCKAVLEPILIARVTKPILTR